MDKWGVTPVPAEHSSQLKKTVLSILFLAAGWIGTPQRLHGHIFIQDLNRYQKDIADYFFYQLPVMAAQGLNWGDPYIGQLKGHPNHFGYGLSLGTVLFPSEMMAKVLENLFQITYDPHLRNQYYILPNWTFDVRLGGFAGLPIDFGAKIGYLPPIPLLGILSYNVFQYGVDIRNRIFRGQFSLTELAIGLSYNSITSRMKGPYTTGNLLDANGGTLFILGGSFSFDWSADIINFKVQLSQPLFRPYLSLFFNIDTGYILMKNAWMIDESTILNLQMPDDPDGGVYEVTSDSVKLQRERGGFSLVLQTGLAFEFRKKLRLDISVMTSVFSMQFMPALNLRFQQ